MPINIQMPELRELKPRITVFGVGGAGGNAVNNMAEQGLEGVEFVVANTDAQALRQSKVERQIQLGTMITEGLGAGSRPEIGAAAAEDSLPDIADCMADSHMCFITAGMGGGTGTGAAPVIARCARELDILTVGVVTKPFQFEGQRRMDIAEQGIAELERHVDTLIVIPNQNLFRIANENTTFSDAFAMADQVLMSGVQGITDLMVKEGLINLDFADVRSIMKDMGKAMMGTGEASGEKRAVEAAEAAISNPLLDDVSMKGAKGLLISITGGSDLTLYEIDEAASRIRSEVDPEANIILGTTTDDTLDGIMRVSVVATGIDKDDALLAMDNGASQAYQRQSVAEKELAPAPQQATVEAPKATIKPQNENIEVRRMTAGETVEKAGMRLEQSEHAEAPQNVAATNTFAPQRPAMVHPSANKQIVQPQPRRLSEQEYSRVAANLGNSTPRANLAQQSPAHALRTEDFSPVAQREIRQSFENKHREPEVNEAAAPDSSNKRNSFFDRLANVGLGRKDNNLVDGVQSHPMTEEAAQPQMRATETQPHAEETVENQEQINLEIPAFLRRQNN